MKNKNNFPTHLFTAALSVQFRENDYSITEGDRNKQVELGLTRSQREVTVTIFPTSLVGINEEFNFMINDFIDLPTSNLSFATAGE